eukprot:scaffold135_cov249-Pinguiococcus_pyrenoidosus.AAC.9
MLPIQVGIPEALRPGRRPRAVPLPPDRRIHRAVEAEVVEDHRRGWPTVAAGVRADTHAAAQSEPGELRVKVLDAQVVLCVALVTVIRSAVVLEGVSDLLARRPRFHRSNRRRHAQRHQRLEVDASVREEFLVLHLTRAIGPKSLRRIAVEQLGDEDGRHPRHVSRDLQRCVAKSVEELLPVPRVPGRQPREHFVRDHAEAPPVDGFAVSNPIQNFRRHVLRGAAHALGTRRRLLDARLCKAKVPKLDVAIVLEEDVLGLQVAVHDVPRVEMLQCERQLGRVEARDSLRETTIPAKVEEELPSRTEVHHHEELLLVLERVVELGDERV